MSNTPRNVRYVIPILCVLWSVPVSAARIWTTGFELNTSTDAMETAFQAASGTAGTGAGIARSGTYGLRVTGQTSTVRTGRCAHFVQTPAVGPYFLRTYVYFAAFPSAENQFFALMDGLVTPDHRISIDNTGTLKLYNGAVQVGGTTTISANAWYRLELHFDGAPAAGSQVLEAFITLEDAALGAAFAASSTLTLSDTTESYMCTGLNLNAEAQTAGDVRFDDLAVNDSTGASQTSFAGAGHVVYAFPNAAGDTNSTATLTGCATHIECWDEGPPPDDATSMITYDTIDDITDVNVTNSATMGIGAGDAITLVDVWVRFKGDTVGASVIRTRIKKAAAGTVAESGAGLISFGTVAWFTNDDVTYPSGSILSRATDPDGAAWTPSTIDSMQIGVHATDVTPNPSVTMVWAVVEYMPAAVTGTGRGTLLLLGVGE